MKTNGSTDTRPRVGVLGLGRMGAPIAERLSRTFPVAVFDVAAIRRGAVPDAQWLPSVRELVGASDVVVTILPGPGEVLECMSEVFPVFEPGALWLDLTSGDPAVTRELADRATGCGVDVVSAPMGGSVAEAVAGDLVFFVSGEDDAVAKALPVLQAVARPDGLRRAGTRVQDGQIVKLLANGLWFANAVAASEAMLIGQGLGLAATDLHRLLRDSAGGSRFLDEHFGDLLDGDYLTTFGIDRVVVELDTITAMSRATNVTTPLLDASARLHRAALDRFGPALGELLAVKLLEDAAGLRLRSDRGAGGTA